jgi:hypothetical protein
VVSFTIQPLYPQEKSPWYPLDRRLDGPQSLSGHGGEEKNSQMVSWTTKIEMNKPIFVFSSPYHSTSLSYHSYSSFSLLFCLIFLLLLLLLLVPLIFLSFYWLSCSFLLHPLPPVVYICGRM